MEDVLKYILIVAEEEHITVCVYHNVHTQSAPRNVKDILHHDRLFFVSSKFFGNLLGHLQTIIGIPAPEAY